MKSNFRSYWWVAILAVNLIPRTSSAAAIGNDGLTAGQRQMQGAKNGYLEDQQKSLENIQTTLSNRVAPTLNDAPPSVPVPNLGQSSDTAQASAPQEDPNTVYISQKKLGELIPGFSIGDSLDDDKNLVFSGKIPAYCKDKLSIQPTLNQDQGVLILNAISSKDPSRSFEACVAACNSGKPSTGQCKKVDLSSILKDDRAISGDADSTLTIAIASSKDGYDLTSWQLQSSDAALEEALAWQVENCRGGKDGEKIEDSMAELLAAENAVKQLETRGYFKGHEDVRDGVLAEIKSSRTDFERAKVREFEQNLADIETSGFLGDSASALNKLRKDVAKFARDDKAKGVVSDDIAALYEHIGAADLAMNGTSSANFATYTATMKRAAGDMRAAVGLKGLSTDSKSTLQQFAVGLNMHEVDYLSNQGPGAMAMYQNLSQAVRRQVQMAAGMSGCQNTGARLQSVNGMMAPTALNSQCAFLSNATQFLGKVDTYEKQSVAAAQDQVRYQNESDIFNQIQEKQKETMAEIQQIQQQAVTNAAYATAQRAATMPQRLPNGQYVGANGQPTNGQIQPNGQYPNQMMMPATQQMQAPRPAMQAPTAPPTFDFFSSGSSSLPSATTLPGSIGSTMFSAGNS